MTDLVTGEAVQLELRLAKLASRGLALALDILVQLGLLVVGVLVLSGTALFVDDALATAIGLVFYVLVIVGYPVAFETFTRGRSLGKMAMGLRVVREDGGPERFRHAFVRGLLGVVEIWLTFGTVALIASLASAQGPADRRLPGRHGRRARTGARSARPRSPPCRRSWSAGPSSSTCPGCPTTWRWPPGSSSPGRPSCPRRCATRWGRRWPARWPRSPRRPPPPGVPAWAFLSAVLAERRRREMLRLGGPPPTYGGWPGPTTAATAAYRRHRRRIAPPPPVPAPPPRRRLRATSRSPRRPEG